MKNSSLAANVIRSIAIIFVLLYHSTIPYLSLARSQNREWWLITDFFLAFTAVCVPLFVMLSGMLLLGKEEPLSTFFRKRASKVIIPFLFWIGLHFLYLIHVEGKSFGLAEMVNSILAGPVYQHLWYMYVIIGLYCATPILRVFSRYANNQLMWYFVVLWAIGSGLFTTLREVQQLNINLPMAATASYSGYFIAGYLLNRYRLNRQYKFVILGWIVILTATTIFLVDFFSARGSVRPINYFCGFTQLNIILQSLLWFALLNSLDYEGINKRFPIFGKIVEAISHASFGIYLIHFVLAQNLFNGTFGFQIHKLGGHLLHPLPGILLSFLAIALPSYLIIFLMQRVPYVKKLVP